MKFTRIIHYSKGEDENGGGLHRKTIHKGSSQSPLPGISLIKIKSVLQMNL
jgi:hypothetical protein